MSRRLRILTWHVHGNYLWYLTHVPHEWWIVADAERSPGRAGASGRLPWGPHVRDAPVEHLARMEFDVVLYQSRAAWESDRHTLLTEAQRRLPSIVLEHDPPQLHPTDTVHWMDDAGTLLVHVTAFNELMWDRASGVRTRVVEHGVELLRPTRWVGDRESGIVVVNHLERRGRRLGVDVYRDVARQVPLALVGMGSESLGGEGEIDQFALPERVASHRFFFNPIRHTSLGLAVIEAMMTGTPVVGLATTEMASVFCHGENGFVDTRLPQLVATMRRLLADRSLARAIGAAGRRTALERFGIGRFVADWERVLRDVAS